MGILRRTANVAVAFVGLSLGVAAGPPKNVPVTSIVLDYAADIAPALHIQSDQEGSYISTTNRLVSQIQAIGDWELDARTPRNASRKIFLDFSHPVPGSAPGGTDPVRPPSAAYKFRIIAKCSLYGNTLLGFIAGAIKSCPLHVGFDYGGTQWALVMDPLTAANGPFPETNYATVTCIFPTSGTSACSQWRFTPSGTYATPDGTVKYRSVAKLLESPTSSAIDHGDFYVSFSMLVSK